MSESTFTRFQKYKKVYSKNAQHLFLILILLPIMASFPSVNLVNFQPEFYILLTQNFLK